MLLAFPASASAADSHRFSRVTTSELSKHSTVVIGSQAIEGFHPQAGSNITYLVTVDLRTHVTTKFHQIESGTIESLGASNGRLAVFYSEVMPTGETKLSIYTIALDGTDRRVIASSSYLGARTCGSEIKSFKALATGRFAVQMSSFGAKTPGGDSCQATDPSTTPQRSNNVELRDQFGRLVETKAVPERFDIDQTTFDKTARYYASFGYSDWRINPFLGGNSRLFDRSSKLDYVMEAGPNHAMWLFSNGGGRTSGNLRFYPNPQQSKESTVIAKRLPRRAAVSFCGNDVWFVADNSRVIKRYSPRSGKVSTVAKASFRISLFRCSSSSAVVWAAGSGGDAATRGFALVPR